MSALEIKRSSTDPLTTCWHVDRQVGAARTRIGASVLIRAGGTKH